MADDTLTLKQTLRREALARRDSLSPEWRNKAALAMCETAKTAIAVNPRTIVAGFWPMRSEVDVRPTLFMLMKQGARLCLPAILDKATMVFREFLHGEPLIDMGFGTSGPGEEALILNPELILTPLAAFDSRGHRIGYGRGYYDRAIAMLIGEGRNPQLIGIAFDCQEVERVPDEPHDMALDKILTESGLRSFNLKPELSTL